MGTDRALEIANLEAYISLRQQEEGRLLAIIRNDSTFPSVRDQANIVLSKLLKDIKVDADELTRLKAL